MFDVLLQARVAGVMRAVRTKLNHHCFESRGKANRALRLLYLLFYFAKLEMGVSSFKLRKWFLDLLCFLKQMVNGIGLMITRFLFNGRRVRDRVNFNSSWAIFWLKYVWWTSVYFRHSGVSY